MNIRTYYSILQSLVSPEDMVKACKAAGYDKLILCDDNLSGVVEFYEQCKKSEIKPIIGVNVKICELSPTDKGEHNKMYDLVLIAQNKLGYKNILKILSISNEPENVLEGPYKKFPRINLESIPSTEGIVALIGQEGSELFETAYKNGFDKTSADYCVSKYKTCFPNIINQQEDGIVWEDVRYLNKEFKEDFLVLLCILLKCKLSELNYYLCKYNLHHLVNYLHTEEEITIHGHLRTKEELKEKYTSVVLDRTESLLSSIEDFDILSKPKVPKFDCPRGLTQQEYLTELCREGWKRRFPTWDSEEKKKIYADRVKYELSVLQSCELDGYFLVVQDYINWAKERMLVGPGRGSSSGSLGAYLIGITEVDPIPYNLLFERFYSADRSAGGVISLPDVDTDFPKYKRQQVIDYIRNKYGKDRVCHIITFHTLKGAGALTEVLRTHDVFESKKIKSITKTIPPDHKISDKLEEQKEKSIIRFCLRNTPEILKELGEWKDDKVVGEYSYYLEQAIRLEGCIRGYGIHASGILISENPTDESASMMISSDCTDKLCGLDMIGAEKVGLVKVDILGLESLDVLEEINLLLMGESNDQ